MPEEPRSTDLSIDVLVEQSGDCNRCAYDARSGAVRLIEVLPPPDHRGVDRHTLTADGKPLLASATMPQQISPNAAVRMCTLAPSELAAAAAGTTADDRGFDAPSISADQLSHRDAFPASGPLTLRAASEEQSAGSADSDPGRLSPARDCLAVLRVARPMLGQSFAIRLPRRRPQQAGPLEPAE